MQKDIDNTDDGVLVYICCKKELIPKILRIFKRKYSENNVYRTILDVEKLYTVKPIDIKYAENYRDEEQWLEWMIEHVDQIWLADQGNYSKEIELAKKYNKIVRRN